MANRQRGRDQETVFDRLGELPPVPNMIGCNLTELNPNENQISLSFEEIPEFLNPAGTLHGEFISAMLDECTGSAIVGLSDAAFVPSTISITTDFLASVATGTVRGTGTITSKGKSIAFLESVLTDEAAPSWYRNDAGVNPISTAAG
ncbi:PaaI family thioesterase [Rhodococcus qingshengii]|uniref:PaaI family thioesterase n=1 Tax=Rhodococcus qingshengii TaxID=334542 RepID=UPI0036DB6341